MSQPDEDDKRYAAEKEMFEKRRAASIKNNHSEDRTYCEDSPNKRHHWLIPGTVEHQRYVIYSLTRTLKEDSEEAARKNLKPSEHLTWKEAEEDVRNLILSNLNKHKVYPMGFCKYCDAMVDGSKGTLSGEEAIALSIISPATTIEQSSKNRLVTAQDPQNPVERPTSEEVKRLANEIQTTGKLAKRIRMVSLTDLFPTIEKYKGQYAPISGAAEVEAFRSLGIKEITSSFVIIDHSITTQEKYLNEVWLNMERQG